MPRAQRQSVIGAVAFAFSAGMVATVNPCGFAIIPAYLSLFLTNEDAPQTWSPVLSGLRVGLLVMSAFVATFVAVGAVFQLVSTAVVKVMPWAALVVGDVLERDGFWWADVTPQYPGTPQAAPDQPWSGSITTIRHWMKTGAVEPAKRTSSDMRLFDDAGLERFKELAAKHEVRKANSINGWSLVIPFQELAKRRGASSCSSG